jgi:hypothetical protein
MRNLLEELPMTRSKEVVCTLLSLLALFVLAAPAAAQPPILPGVDLFSTGTGQNPTVVSFANNPIPADFFCPGSAPFTGAIALQGVPLSTSPAGVTGGADTIVERLTQGNFVNGVATIPVIVRALQLTSVSTLQVTCANGTTTNWRVDSCLCGQQPRTNIEVKVDDPVCGCGHFSGKLSLNVCLRFTEIHTGETRGPIRQPITLAINNMPWCPKAGTGETTVNERFKVDSNCDGQTDIDLPGTTNFHPGWTCALQAQAAVAGNCWSIYASLTHCHENPNPDDVHDHCINPICGRPPG